MPCLAGLNDAPRSGRPSTDPVKHFRLRRDTVHLWCLDMANHRGQWERTPYRKYLDELVVLVIETFPWTLTLIA
jgi:hypothetical protein